METNTINLGELSEPVRSFLAEASRRNGLVIRDEGGRACFGVVPYTEADPEELKRAIEALGQLQKSVGKRMRDHNITEDELDQALLAELKQH